MRGLRVAAIIGALALIVSAAVAESAVRRVSIKTPVQAGRVASVTVNVAPRAKCTIAVKAGSYVPTPRGLAPKTGGRITWRWQLRLSAPPGLSPVIVRCGKSGVLTTKFTVLAPDPEMSLNDASIAACQQAPARVRAKYGTELGSLPESTLVTLRRKYGEFNCGLSNRYYTEIGSFYLLSIRPGAARCTFVLSARVVWPNTGKPYDGYTGPVDETYIETCKSLRG